MNTLVAILDKDVFGSDPLVELAGPDNITGDGAAEIWSEVTGKPVAYTGDDIGLSFKNQTAGMMPGWQAHDLMAMFRGYQRQGMRAKPGAVDRLAKLIGRPLRSYRAFAEETFKQCQDQ